MLKNENIICISSIDWDFIWQGHQEIMSTLAKNGNRVLFIENTGVRAPNIKDVSRLRKRILNYCKGIKGIRKETDNLYIFSPIILPFPYSFIARQINRFLFLSVLQRWINISHFTDPIIWVFLPTGITLDIINNINKKLVVYYCIDNFAVSSVSANKIKKTEKKLFETSDLVFVTSKALYDGCARYNSEVHIFPFGVDTTNFEKARITKSEIPDEIKDIKKPIIGYVGGIHKWIDFRLIKYLALRYSEYVFVFIGPVQTDIGILEGIANIYFLGSKSHKELPNLIKSFSVAIIPYIVTEYTKNVYPTKLNEYLAIGKPVISTCLPEIEMFNRKYSNIVYLSRTAEEFGQCIEKAIKEDNKVFQERRVAVSWDNNWTNRVEQMCSLIERSIKKKRLDEELRWKESLIAFYRTAHRKLAKFLLPTIAVYLVVFYTPLFWFLAQPLKITDYPQKSDAIVVFGGGVGESGKVGQGYEERVKNAVELYQNGYAKYIIFSSGYMYIFKEPLVMKALAVSLGVPADAIILEDKAGNTYQNVKLVTDILRKNNWSQIILVSSPYHMRRASLVIGKNAPEIKVIYASKLTSAFYSHDINSGGMPRKQINLQQIRGLINEYLAIAYYWWKGYI